MRFTLYDAAFASIAHIGGKNAGRLMSQVTLLGGLASTVFWPVGYLLAEHFGWRGTLFIYAVVALLTGRCTWRCQIRDPMWWKHR